MATRRTSLTKESSKWQAEPVVRPAPPPAAATLQRVAGNRAVLSLLGAQAKLEVGSVNDPAEAEADRVADAVVQALRSPGTAESTGGDSGARRLVSRLVQRRSTGSVGPEGGEVNPEVERSLEAARGQGSPVPSGIRRRMEEVTGADFGGVRLHAGAQAQGLSEQMGATAFTVGSDVYFRSGLPDSTTQDGQRLLAHELAHTVQQGGAKSL